MKQGTSWSGKSIKTVRWCNTCKCCLLWRYKWSSGVPDTGETRTGLHRSQHHEESHCIRVLGWWWKSDQTSPAFCHHVTHCLPLLDGVHHTLSSGLQFLTFHFQLHTVSQHKAPCQDFNSQTEAQSCSITLGTGTALDQSNTLFLVWLVGALGSSFANPKAFYLVTSAPWTNEKVIVKLTLE
jgi:hypothetical protein